MLGEVDKAQRLANIKSKIEQLLARNQEEVGEGKSVSEIETTLLSELLTIGKLMMTDRLLTEEATLESRGYDIECAPLKKEGGVKKKVVNKGVVCRVYVGIFGKARITRQRYDLPSGRSYYPFDEYLSLPQTQYSYTLQNWMGKEGTDKDYRNSVNMINTILSLNLQGTHVQRVMSDLGPLVDCYYDGRPILNKAELAQEGTHVAFGHDGKGVRIIESERDLKPTQPKARLMKGQKRGTKKEATVSVDFSFNPQVRDSESILRGLFREAPLKKSKASNKGTKLGNQKAANRLSITVHKRAFLSNQKGGIDYTMQRLVARSGSEQKPIVALVDCGPGLEAGIRRAAKKHGVEDRLSAIIADVVHVSEYIWKAANATLGEKSEKRTSWVRMRMKDLLEGRMDTLLTHLTTERDREGKTESEVTKLTSTITYLTNHRHKMEYQTYLKKGYPISTGLIEGCCGHLVKDRMEHSGMRWTKQGAQNMMDLRAVNKNEDWNDFMQFIQNHKTPNRLRIRA